MDFILRLAPLALSLAGFSGLVAALRSRNIKSWLPRERFLLWMLLTASLGVMFFALLPAALDSVGASSQVTWTVSSAGLGLYLLIAVIFATRAERRLVGRGERRVRPQAWLLFPLTFLVSVGLFINASAIAFAPSSGFYSLALFIVLMEASAMFLLLLTFPSGESGG